MTLVSEPRNVVASNDQDGEGVRISWKRPVNDIIGYIIRYKYVQVRIPKRTGRLRAQFFRNLFLISFCDATQTGHGHRMDQRRRRHERDQPQARQLETADTICGRGRAHLHRQR